MIRAIALDDEPLALKVIENFCSRIDSVELQKTFTQSNEAQKYLRKFPVDLIFLDIQMPTQSGLDFYTSIGQDVQVIFTTAYSEYAVEGFNVNAVDYLLKPFSFDRFCQAIEKAKSVLDRTGSKANPFLFVRADYSLMKLSISEILTIEGLDDYLKIHIANQKPVVTRMTMKSILEKLPVGEFIRVHRSFIVPISKISKVRNKIIYIGDQEIPLSPAFEDDFFKTIRNG